MGVTWTFDLLEFESAVFGAPVGRVILAEEGGAALETLTRGWLGDGFWLVSARIPADHKDAAQDLMMHGFTVMETLVTLERSLFGADIFSHRVRPADGDDRMACLAIARVAFSYDRFHNDARVPDALADRLKEMWISNAFQGRADAILVVEENRQVAGFVTCRIDGGAAVIDLIAVAPDHQGRGIGKALVQGVLEHYTDRKTVVRVGTQQVNTSSLALYEGLGFVRVQLQETFHWIHERGAP